jgi:hypothetical protein
MHTELTESKSESPCAPNAGNSVTQPYRILIHAEYLHSCSRSPPISHKRSRSGPRCVSMECYIWRWWYSPPNQDHGVGEGKQSKIKKRISQSTGRVKNRVAAYSTYQISIPSSVSLEPWKIEAVFCRSRTRMQSVPSFLSLQNKARPIIILLLLDGKRRAPEGEEYCRLTNWRPRTQAEDVVEIVQSSTTFWTGGQNS